MELGKPGQYRLLVMSFLNRLSSKLIVISSVVAVTAIIVLLVPTLVPLNQEPLRDEIPDAIRTINVASIAGMTSAASNALPGDHIILQDGYYDSSSVIHVDIDGTAENPIVLTAQSDGGAEIGGPSGFALNGTSYVVIKGFKFTHYPGVSSVAVPCSDCIGVRFTSNTFAINNENNKTSHWLGITGRSSGVRIDHNVFQYKTTEGAFLIIVGEGEVIPQKTLVDHNFFRDQLYNGGNGGECVIIGHSSQGRIPANSIVEYNTFERCNGDAEVVSVKSSNNIFRYNTFHDNAGSLVFRHGSGQIADGNRFLDGQNGIRVYGANHKIVNNYFENNLADGGSASYPLLIPRGTVFDDSVSENAGYSQPRNILVVHNTFVKNGANIVIGSSTGEFLPENIIVANNILAGNYGVFVDVQSGDVSFRNNLIYPSGTAIIGNIPTTGYTEIDPELVRVDGLMVPSASSPAVDAVDASDTYGVSTDIEGSARTGRHDLGAYELP